MRKIKIRRRIYGEITGKIANAPIESGGIIACDETGEICDFDFCAGSGNEYVIDTARFNGAISEWASDGKKFCGIIHSHPNGLSELSPRDVDYARSVLECNPVLDEVLMGIVTVRNFGGVLYMYSVRKTTCEKIKAEVTNRI